MKLYLAPASIPCAASNFLLGVYPSDSILINTIRNLRPNAQLADLFRRHKKNRTST